jgi:hypothetical protein
MMKRFNISIAKFKNEILLLPHLQGQSIFYEEMNWDKIIYLIFYILRKLHCNL